MLQENAITRTKDILITYLREFLANYDNYQDFCEKDFSNAVIFDKQPKVLEKCPSILLVAINGNYINSGIGDIAHELYDEYGTCIGYRYSGMFELPITLEMAVQTTRERDLITDLVSTALRVILRRHLEAAGILIKDMRFGGENEITYDGNPLYISTLQLTTWSEWYRDISLLPFKGIDIDVKLDSTK